MTVITDGSKIGGLKVNPETGAALVEVLGGAGTGGGSGGGTTNGLTDAQLRASPVPVQPDIAYGTGNADAKTQRVTLAADGPAVSAIGTKADAPAPEDGTGNYSILSALKRILLNGVTLLARIPALRGGLFPVDASGKPVTVNSFTTKLRDAFQTFPGTNWTIAKQGAGDLLFIDGNAGGASYLVVSLNPLTPGNETWVESSAAYTMPAELAIGLHASQRVVGQEFSVELVSTEAPVALPELSIASISQAASVLSVQTTNNHGLRVGQRFGVYGCQDSRLNYPALVIASTPTANTFTATAGPAGAIPALNVGPFLGQGTVFIRSAMGGAPNGTSLILENAVATNASAYVKAEGGDATPMGGVMNANHSIAINSTASNQFIVAALNYAFRPTTEYRLSMLADRVQWSDVLVDNTGQSSNRANFTQIAPNPDQNYKIRMRATNAKALTVPVGKIVSATKTGTSTVTVVTENDHGLTVADVVNLYGSRDQTNFANLTVATAVTSIVNSKTFTIVWGTAFAGVSYGGYVSRVQGGQVQQGAIAQAIQSVSRTGNVVALLGSANWAGLVVGDTTNIHGCRNAVDGGDLGIDGAYRVRDIQTTTIYLEPLAGAPTGADIVTVNAGGALIKRTDYRVSYVRLFDYERLRVEALARPASDAASAFPVAVSNAITAAISNTPNVSVTNNPVLGASANQIGNIGTIIGGSVSEDAAATANPLIVGGVARGALTPTSIVAGDAVRLTMTLGGAAVFKPYSVPEVDWQFTGQVTTTADTAIKATAGAGYRNYCTALQLQNAGAAASVVSIKDGATVIWQASLAANMTAPVAIPFPTPLKSTAAAALNIASSVATTIIVNAQGYAAP